MSMELVARNPQELVAAHNQMLDWVTKKVTLCEVEIVEKQHGLDAAITKHFDKKPFSAALRRAERRRDFFVKVRGAVQAGYLIVPNFWMNVFMIRTARKGPRGGGKSSTYQLTQTTEKLPAGEGRNVNPTPSHFAHTYTNEDGKKKTIYTPADFEDADFPMEMANAGVVDRTGDAAALLVFDEIGIARQDGDPFIVGRIKNPSQKSDVSFFIAWQFDPSRL